MTNEIFKRILVPFDGSKYSQNALGQAINIAKKAGTQIFIITAVDPSGFPLGMLLKPGSKFEKSIKVYITEVKLQVRKKLLAEVNACKAKGVSEAYYDVIIGNPVDSILKFMNETKIDLIIIASQGKHGIGKLKTLGSVSRKVAELATCPVMIIH